MICNEGSHHAQVQGLLELQTIDLSGKTVHDEALDGIGMLLQLGQLQTLTLKQAKLRPAAARRLSLELATTRSCTKLKCVTAS